MQHGFPSRGGNGRLEPPKLRGVDERRSSIEHTLADASRRGPAAGGRLHGLRRRRSLRRPRSHLAGHRGGRIGRVAFDDRGLRRDRRRGGRGCRARRRRPRPRGGCDRPGSSRRRARRARRTPPPRRRARGRRAPSGALAARRLRRGASPSPRRAGERVLVALSGGVDSAVAALLRARARAREVVAVTLKLWADQRDRRRAELLLARGGPGRPPGRTLARDPAPDARPRARVPRRGRRAVHRRIRRGADARTRASSATATLRIDAMIALADRLGARALATGHYARIADDGDGPLLTRAADGAKDQTYMLSGLAPSSLARLRLPAGRPDQARGARDRRSAPASRSPAAPRARISASSPARASATSCAATPGSSDRPGRGRRPLRVARSGRTAATTTSRSASAAASASPSREPLFVLATDAAAQSGHRSAPRDELATSRVRIRGATPPPRGATG